MSTDCPHILSTRKWVRDVVIAQGFCPFAKREYDLDRIHYSVVEAVDFDGQLEQIIRECEALDADASRETSLLIFPNGLSEFENYLNFLDLAAALLKMQGYEGIYQLASFHPDYLFADMAADDPSHFTNRSPFPVVHILREASVETVLKTYSDPEIIAQRNIERTRRVGVDTLKNLLSNCIVS